MRKYRTQSAGPAPPSGWKISGDRYMPEEPPQGVKFWTAACTPSLTPMAAQAEEDDAAEIDVTGITEHQIDVARQRDVERGEDQALAQLDIVADRRRDDEGRDHQRDDPEKGPAHQPRHHKAPRRAAKTPAGNAISTT